MSNNQEVTIKDVVRATIEELHSVSIPAYLVQDQNLIRSVSFPINRAINNLNAIMMAIGEAEKKKESEENVIELDLDDEAEIHNTNEGGSENEEKDQLEGTV